MGVSLSEAVKEELRWWASRLNVDIGVSFPTPPPQVILSTDASLIGWGGFIPEAMVQGLWSPEEARQHINVLELQAVWNCLLELGTLVFQRRVLVKTDNTTVLA
jgi:hypothetical protein